MPLDLHLPAPGTYPRSPKHAPTGAMAPASDLRSVGELLIDADYHARTLLLDTEAAAAPGLLRSWAQTVTVATQLWHVLPGSGHVAAERRRPVDRVSELATSIQADLANARWPGPGAGDQRMHEIAGNLTSAHELVDKYGADVPAYRADVKADLEASRARIVHTVYVATHGVVVALAEEGRLRASDPTRTEAIRAAAAHQRGRYEVGPGVRWADRLGVVERTLSAYLRPGHYTEALAGEQTAPTVGLPRLSEALARFDIQAHRTLVDAPTAANLVLITRTEGMFFGAALALTRAAAETGHLDQSTVDPARLDHGLTAAGEAWMGLARRWRDLMPQGARIDPSLAATAAQLRTACRELTHTGDQLASPASSANRVDLAEAFPTIVRYVDAAAEVAEATRAAANADDLLAPARSVIRRISSDMEEGLIPDVDGLISAELIARAGRGNHLGPVPRPLLLAIDGATTVASRTSAAAAGAAGVHRDAGPPPPSSRKPRDEPAGLAAAVARPPVP